MRRSGLWALLFIAALVPCLLAQDPVPAEPPPTDGRSMIYPRTGIIVVEPGPGIIYLIGDVKVEIGDLRITHCENLVAWLADKKRDGTPRPEPADRGALAGAARQEGLAKASEVVKEIYAEGTVLFQQGEEFARADYIYLDLVNNRGLIVNASLAIPLPSDPRKPREAALYLRAEELRLLAQDRVQASGIRVSTCAFGHPHFHLASEVMEVIKDRPGAIEPDNPDSPLRDNYHLDARGNLLYVGRFPVFWIPQFVGDTAERGVFNYIEDVRFSHSNQFGTELGLTIGDDIRDSDGRRWGHWSVPIDEYTKRGPGAGVDLVYGNDRYYDHRGNLVTRYQSDHGEDKVYGEPPDDDRYRVNWQHRQKLPWELQLDVELALFSDRGYYPTYFKGDFRNDKPPENLLYLKRAFGSSYLTALSTIRFNDFETVVEYQPELEYDLVYEPLFDLFDRPIYLDGTVRFSKNRIKYDDALNLRPRGSLRADWDTLFEYPFPLGPFTLTPFAGPRYTWYQEDLAERRSRDRLGITSGATLSLQAWRIYDAFDGLFGLDGLRHVTYPEVTFRNTSGVGLHPDELIPFDEVDQFDNVQVIEFSVRNLFQTVRHRESGPQVENVIDVETEIDYFPKAHRDQGGEEWSNLIVDAIVRFSDDLQLATDVEYDFYGKDFEVANFALGYTPDRDFQAYTGYRHFHSFYDAVFFQANWRIEEKWQITGETAYNFETDRGLDHRLTLTRIDHDWVFQVHLRADASQNDFSISVSFEPRLFWDPRSYPRGLRSEPRLLYLGSGLSN